MKHTLLKRLKAALSLRQIQGNETCRKINPVLRLKFGLASSSGWDTKTRSLTVLHLRCVQDDRLLTSCLLPPSILASYELRAKSERRAFSENWGVRGGWMDVIN